MPEVNNTVMSISHRFENMVPPLASVPNSQRNYRYITPAAIDIFLLGELLFPVVAVFA